MVEIVLIVVHPAFPSPGPADRTPVVAWCSHSYLLDHLTFRLSDVDAAADPPALPPLMACADWCCTGYD